MDDSLKEIKDHKASYAGFVSVLSLASLAVYFLSSGPVISYVEKKTEYKSPANKIKNLVYHPLIFASKWDIINRGLSSYMNLFDREDWFRKKLAFYLLIQAREEIKKKNLNKAIRLAQSADKLKLRYGLFDDRPALIFEDVARRKRSRSKSVRKAHRSSTPVAN